MPAKKTDASTKINKTPINPINIPIHACIDNFSFNNKYENIAVKIGDILLNVWASAKGILAIL